jgi:hypothetical protein
VTPPTAIETLAASAHAARARPVQDWHPARCEDGHFRILADGTWLHEGQPIRRPELVKLFASLLRREPDGSHVVVTPAEKLSVEVEDAPFVAVELATEGTYAARRLAFRLNTDDLVVAGPDHPITLANGRPYLHVRHDLAARIERAVFYELADLALAEDAHGLYSNGRFFALA